MTAVSGSAARCKLFLACFPDAQAAAQLARLVDDLRTHVPHARWSSPQRRHMTLHFLAASEEPDSAAIERARQVASQWRSDPFSIVLDHLRMLGHPRRPALALTASTLPETVQSAWSVLHHDVLAAGFEGEAGRPFLAHVTLAHAEPGVVLPQVPAIGLQVHECRLVLSRAGQADYDLLGRWPLHR